MIMVFKRWSIQSESYDSVVVDDDPDKSSTVSGASIITLNSNMPSVVYVTAEYQTPAEAEAIELQKALDQVQLELESYSNTKILDSIPDNTNDIKNFFEQILENLGKMTNGELTFSLDDFQQDNGLTTLPTTSAQGKVTYKYTLIVQNKDATALSSAQKSLTLKVKEKDNIPYTVIISGGSLQGVTADEILASGKFKKTYHLSEIERSSGGALQLSLVSTDRTSSNYYYDGWDISPGDASTSLSSVSSSDSYQATGSAMLVLTEQSPMQINVTAKYKTKSTYTGGGGGWIPTTPTTPEKPKEEEKPKNPEKTDPETTTDPSPASKPISTTTKTNTATVSVSDLQKVVNDKTNAGMTVKYQNATLTFDEKAVESIVKQAKEIGSSTLKVVCKADAQSSLNSAQKKALKNKTVIGCYQVYLKCGNRTISDFGTGKVKVKVPLKLKSGQKSKNVKLYYVDEKGKLTKKTAIYFNGKLTFTTTHFSIYAAIYPKQTTTTDSGKNDTSDKTDTKDKTQKPTQVTGTENETVPGGVVDDSVIGLPKAEENEEISYRTLQLHLSRSDDTSVRLGWNQVPGASGYELYGARCNTKTKKYEIIQITTLDSPTMTAWMCDNLKKNTYYKFIVRAYMIKDGEKVYIARSRSAHVSTGGGGYGFIRDVIVDKPKVTLGVGKTSVIKATIDTAAQKIRSHYDLRFESSDASIATVSSSGKITAKKKGTCTIYVYTQNGLYTTVKVTVK